MTTGPIPAAGVKVTVILFVIVIVFHFAVTEARGARFGNGFDISYISVEVMWFGYVVFDVAITVAIWACHSVGLNLGRIGFFDILSETTQCIIMSLP